MTKGPKAPSARGSNIERSNERLVTTRALTVNFREHGEIQLPEGLRVGRLRGPNGGRIVLDEFPKAIFKPNSMVHWDADHYGLDIPADAVRDLNKPDREPVTEHVSAPSNARSSRTDKEAGALPPEDQEVLTQSADTTAEVSRLATKGTSQGGLGAPVPPNPFGAAAGWRFSPDPEQLSLALHNAQSIEVTNREYTSLDRRGKPIWTWVRTDPKAELSAKGKRMDELEGHLLDLVKEGELRGSVLYANGEEAEFRDDGVQAVEEAIRSIRPDHPQVARQMTAIAEEMKDLHKAMKDLRETINKRKEDGKLPDDAMEGEAWELPVMLPVSYDEPHVTPEVYAQDLEMGWKNGFGGETEIFRKTDDGEKAYLCVTSLGDNPSSEVTRSFIALGLCPPVEVASRYLRDYGASEMERALNRGDEKEVERLRCTARACVRALDRRVFDSHLNLKTLGEILGLAGDNDTVAAAYAKYPDATLGKAMGAIEKAFGMLVPDLDHPALIRQKARDTREFLRETFEEMGLTGGGTPQPVVKVPEALTPETIDARFTEVARMALGLIEVRARKAMSEHSTLTEFFIEAGEAYFTTTAGKKLNIANEDVLRDHPYLNPVAELFDKWDESMQLKHDFIRFTAGGPKRTEWGPE